MFCSEKVVRCENDRISSTYQVSGVLLRVNCETEFIKAYPLEFKQNGSSNVQGPYLPSLRIYQEVLFRDNYESGELPLVNAPGSHMT